MTKEQIKEWFVKANDTMVFFFGASWKTTVSGVVGGLAVALMPVIQSGTIDKRSIGIGLAIGVLGILSKDHGK